MKTLLGILLAGSVILNIWFWYSDDLGSTDCYVTPGFQEPETITEESARGDAEIYKSTLSDGDSITGGIITRSAFDELLCTEKCNGISYTLARTRDSDGKLSGVFVIYNGVNVEYDESSRKIITVTGLGTQYYTTRHWCPPTCFAM